MTMHKFVMKMSQRWNYRTFIKNKKQPVTIVGQLLKTQEEIIEWKVSGSIFELADVMITIAGLRNHDRALADMFEITILSMITVPRWILSLSILIKLIINIFRKWKKVNGVWHH